MKASLKLECIGDNRLCWLRALDRLSGGSGSLGGGYWVAEIRGTHPKYKYDRAFLRCKKDYRNANSVGSRGVYAHYILEEDKIYEVSEPRSWKRIDRYFCSVTPQGDIERMTEEEVQAWLRNRSESTSATPQENA